MRTSFRPEHALGQLLWDFRVRHHLTQKEAAKVLGVSVVTLQSYEKGTDVKSGEPINPRRNTLELMAMRMTDHAAQLGQPHPVSVEALAVAAGLITQEALDLRDGIDEPPTDEELARGDLKIPGLEDLAANAITGWEELSAAQQAQIRDVVKATAQAMAAQMLSGKRQRKLK